MVTYEIDPKERLIRTQCSGPVTLAEVVAHFEELAADPACPNFLNVLLDLRTIESLPQTGQLEAVTRAVRKVQSKVRFGLCAIAVERDAVFGVFRMFQVMAQDHFTAIRVFRALAEAEAWLASQRFPQDRA
jgi:hypothetical protein